MSTPLQLELEGELTLEHGSIQPRIIGAGREIQVRVESIRDALTLWRTYRQTTATLPYSLPGSLLAPEITVWIGSRPIAQGQLSGRRFSFRPLLFRYIRGK